MLIMFACNDHRNGHHQGWFDAVSIETGDESLEFEGPRVEMRRRTDGRVGIGRHTFSYRRWSTWVGNRCWDELDIVEPVQLLEYLRQRGYTCHCGPSEFFEAFNDGNDLSEFEVFLKGETEDNQKPQATENER